MKRRILFAGIRFGYFWVDEYLHFTYDVCSVGFVYHGEATLAELVFKDVLSFSGPDCRSFEFHLTEELLFKIL